MIQVLKAYQAQKNWLVGGNKLVQWVPHNFKILNIPVVQVKILSLLSEECFAHKRFELNKLLCFFFHRIVTHH